MIPRIRKSIEEKDQGFTLIELLVVMIIIGILAAIAIPVFMNQRKKAVDTAAKSDVSIVGKEVATYYVDSSTTPTVGITADRYLVAGADVGATSDGISAMTIDATDATHWCVEATYAGGTATTVAYSAQAGLGAPGSSCTTAGELTGP